MMLPYRKDHVQGLWEELDQWRDRLDYKGPLPRAWVGRRRRDLEAEAVAASTVMEGVPVTLDEVNFWQPSGGRRFHALEPGEPFLFKLHYPENAIVGGGPS